MNQPVIVFCDLETVPNLDAALEVWPQLSNVPGSTLRASITSIACAGWKLLGESEVHCINAWDFPAWDVDVNDDKALCEALYPVLLKADCLVTHNGRRFDWKFIQTRLRYHKLPPLPEIHHVDTCSEVRSNLYLFNNRLNTVAKFLTDEEKMDHEGWPLWVKVHGGTKNRVRDRDAEARMSEYCKQDIVTLEAVFHELRPVIKSLPNYNLFSPFKEKSCPQCGSTRLKSEGKRYTKTRAYRRYCCQDCHKWSHTDLKDEVPR